MPGYGPGTPAYDNLNPTLQQIANMIMMESGGRVWIGSGWRSGQQQAHLYNEWKAGRHDVPRVARPGTSRHEHGAAIDFGGDLRLAQQLGRKYGLVFPMDDEPWHGQLGEGVQASGEPDFNNMGIQYNLNYIGGGPMARPEDVLANRMASVMSVIGGDEFTSGANKLLDPLESAQQFIQPTSENVQDMVDPTGSISGQVPEAGAHQTAPLSPTQYSQPVVSGTNLQNTDVQIQPAGDKGQLGAYAQSLFGQYGFSPEDYPALVALWNKESGDPGAGSSRVTWNPLAQNPRSTAFGIAQFLNGTWAGTGFQKSTNPQIQIQAGLTYIKSRYGNPRNALAFHLRNNWY